MLKVRFEFLKRILALFLAVIILGGMLPKTAVTATETGTITPQAVTTEEYLTSIEEAAEAMKQHYLQRDESFEIYLTLPVDEVTSLSGIVEQMDELAFVHTGVGVEGDYLKQNLLGGGLSFEYYTQNRNFYITISFEEEYWTTAEQEERISQLLPAIYEELDLEDDSEYMKVFKIYRWIANHVTYDYDSLELKNTTGEMFYPAWSAYGALEYGTCVCQGYALLMYRMLLDHGVDARYIHGYSDTGEAHAWNIVKVGDLYYNMDVTWDSYTENRPASMYYFLQGDDFFDTHIRDSRYTTEEFLAEYPLSNEDYSPPDQLASGMCGDDVYWTISEEGVLTIYGTGEMYNYISQGYEPAMSPWRAYNSQITEIVVEQGVTSIGRCAFYKCEAKTVTIADSVTKVDMYAFGEMGYLETVTLGSGLEYLAEFVFLDSNSSAEVYFTGDAPELAENALDWFGGTVYYPAGNDTWKEAIAACTDPVNWVAYGDSGVLMGDVNLDGVVDILDANLVAAYYNERVDFTDAQIAVADVNGDEQIDILDANLIAAFYNERIDSFPVGA